MLDWRGSEVSARVLGLITGKMDEILSEFVRVAKRVHPPQVRTGTFQGSIRMESAREVRGELVGYCGSYNVDYAIYLEFGTRYMPEFRPLRKTADGVFPKLREKLRGIID